MIDHQRGSYGCGADAACVEGSCVAEALPGDRHVRGRGDLRQRRDVPAGDTESRSRMRFRL